MTRSTDWTTLPDDWRVAGTATSKATITNGCARIETHRARCFIEEMLPKVAQLTTFGRLAFVQTPHFAGTIERQRVRSSLRLCSGLLAEDVGSRTSPRGHGSGAVRPACHRLELVGHVLSRGGRENAEALLPTTRHPAVTERGVPRCDLEIGPHSLGPVQHLSTPG